MILVDQARVAASFERAEDYARNAGVQRTIAAELAGRIACIALPERPRILEIGCGTGFLTRALIERGVGGEWLITDKAPAMVARCREAIGEGEGWKFTTLDGEYGVAGHDGRYDLVCASMTFQWFDDLESAVARLLDLLAPGGRLVFNTLAGGTFAEWRAAHALCGVRSGAITFPPSGELRAMLEKFEPLAIEVNRHVEQHRDARQFLGRLKQIGAATAREGHKPLAPGELKRVMAAFDASGAEATYEVVTCHIVKPGG